MPVTLSWLSPSADPPRGHAAHTGRVLIAVIEADGEDPPLPTAAVQGVSSSTDTPSSLLSLTGSGAFFFISFRLRTSTNTENAMAK